MHRSGSQRRRLGKGIGVPKGMLHHMTLDILKQESMSGSELMDEIEHYTDWRPSPGSMYPLLAILEEQRLIEQVSSDLPTLKKYSLTQAGLREVEKRKRSWTHIKSHYHSVQKIYWRLFQGMREEVFEANYRLLNALEKINPLIVDNREASARVRGILEETTKEIEKINKQLENPE